MICATILTEIQPIQRVCKYHLLLKQLSDFTLSSDCPSADHDIRQALDIMRALGDKVNSATGDLAYEDRIRKTIGLQEKLGPFQSVSPFHTRCGDRLLKAVPIVGHLARYLQAARTDGYVRCSTCDLPVRRPHKRYIYGLHPF